MGFDKTTNFICDGKSAGFTAIDFWEWYHSGMLDGRSVGFLGKFLVMKSLDVNQDRRHRSDFDFVYHSLRVSVQTSTIFAADSGRQYVGNQEIKFAIGENPDAYDVAVFALLTTPDASNLDRWSFYVSDSGSLSVFRNQSSITVSTLEKIGCHSLGFSDLRMAVDELAAPAAPVLPVGSVFVGNDSEKSELSHLIACYQASNYSDRISVWSLLRKYLCEPNIAMEGIK